MKALLVYPKFPVTFWGQEHTRSFTGKSAVLAPLGMLTMAALLPRHWHLRLVDMNVDSLDEAALAWADVVMVGGMRIQRRSFHEVVHRAHAMGKKVVAGGPYVTTDPGAAADVDYLVLGEAEETLPDFARALEEGRAPPVVKASQYPDLTKTPVPRYDLVRPDRYNCFGVQFSRGCPFSCEFCDIIELFGRVPRTKTPDQVLCELDSIRATGFAGSVFLVDDNFIGNKAQAKRLLPHISAWNRRHGHPFDYFTEASINLAADDELVDALVDANFTAVFIGLESPSRESLRAAHKMQNLAVEPVKAVEKLTRRGLDVMAGFIVGFDTDREDVFDRQIEFINASPIGMAMVGMLIALPGTQLWRRLEREGRLRDAGGGVIAMEPNFVPRMPSSALMRGYGRILAAIYEPRAYFERSLLALTLQDHGRERPSKRAFWFAARCLVVSFVRQGFLASYRGEYWRFLWRVLRRVPRLFPDAVTLAIRGEHFLRYTAQDVLPRIEKQLASPPAPEFSNALRPTSTRAAELGAA